MEVVFAFTDGDVWRPGIGDPTVMGWITVAAYFGAAALCLHQALESRRRRTTAERAIFWCILTAFLFLLGINKQLDLQTLLTLTGRNIFIELGLYEYRRVVQAIFVAAVGITGVASALLMKGLVRRQKDLRLPLIGFVLLVVFVVVRAASFHHMDQLINFRFAGVRMNWVLELGAIAVLALGASRSGKRLLQSEAAQAERFATA
ncbi:MAG TPA: hypothetical protein VF773_18935 [Verrucomicrobiae bacterium]